MPRTPAPLRASITSSNARNRWLDASMRRTEAGEYHAMKSAAPNMGKRCVARLSSVLRGVGPDSGYGSWPKPALGPA